MAGDWRDWSSPESPWLKEGYYVSYRMGAVTFYEYIFGRDFAHYVQELGTIDADDDWGPEVDENLVPTVGYDNENNVNQIWQTIFGIDGQVYIYIELPTDRHRHGLPKVPKPRRELRTVSHFEEYLSPFYEPSFLTEHIMMKPGFDRINLSAYNPQSIDMAPSLNWIIAKLVTERVGSEEYGVLRTPVIPNDETKTDKIRQKWEDTLDKLYKHQIPCRPLTLQPVWAPETET